MPCISAEGSQERALLCREEKGKDKQALGHLSGLLGSMRVILLPGFPRGIGAVQREMGWKLESEWPDSQLQGLEVTTLLQGPVLSLPPWRPVTELIAPDTHFFLVLAVNLCGLYRAFQASLCPL